MDRRETTLSVLERISGVPRAELTEDKQLAGDLGVDSPKALEMLIELEEKLEIEIGDEQAGEMATVGDILAFVDRTSG
jgi:acyl carrier protein